GQQLERHRRTVELTAAVVGQHDRVDAEVGELLRVLERLHALDGELAGPHGADLGEVVEVDGRVHRRVEQLTDGSAGLRQGGELELRSGQEVPPPPRTGNRVEDRLRRQLRRDGEAVAGIAQTSTCHGGVDGEEQGVETGVLRSLDEAVGD